MSLASRAISVASLAPRAVLLAALVGAISLVTAPVSLAQTPGDAEKAAKARAAFIEKADALVSDRNFDGKTTARFHLRTDDPRLDLKAAADLLESFQSFFDAFWKDRMELKPCDDRTEIFLFWSYFKYKQLLGDVATDGDDRPVGHYHMLADAVALHTDSTYPGDLGGVIVHEASHRLIQKRIYGGASEPSLWVGEGLATYFGLTYRDEKEGFRAGEVGGRGAVLVTGGAPRAREASARLDRYRTALKKDETALIDRVIRIEDPETFYGPAAREAYPASWLLVHFLLHGDEGKHAAGFAQYLKHEAAGAGGADVLYKDIGMDAAALQAAFDEHVKRLKVR